MCQPLTASSFERRPPIAINVLLSPSNTAFGGGTSHSPPPIARCRAKLNFGARRSYARRESRIKIVNRPFPGAFPHAYMGRQFRNNRSARIKGSVATGVRTSIYNVFGALSMAAACLALPRIFGAFSALCCASPQDTGASRDRPAEKPAARPPGKRPNTP